MLEKIKKKAMKNTANTERLVGWPASHEPPTHRGIGLEI